MVKQRYAFGGNARICVTYLACHSLSIQSFVLRILVVPFHALVALQELSFGVRGSISIYYFNYTILVLED